MRIRVQIRVKFTHCKLLHSTNESDRYSQAKTVLKHRLIKGMKAAGDNLEGFRCWTRRGVIITM
jgi:hypothetical protein